MPEFNEAFWRWFGASQVVDAEGQPLRVYHGTSADFSEFSEEHLGRHSHARSTELGFFFTDNHYVARLFISAEGGNIMPVYLSLQNPLEIGFYTPGERKRSLGDPFDFMRDAIVKKSGKSSWEDVTREDVLHWKEILLSQGFDGIALLHTAMDAAGGATARSLENPYHNMYVAFYPTQIKSATGNDGTWDAGDPDITSNPREAQIKSHAKRLGADSTGCGELYQYRYTAGRSAVTITERDDGLFDADGAFGTGIGLDMVEALHALWEKEYADKKFIQRVAKGIWDSGSPSEHAPDPETWGTASNPPGSKKIGRATLEYGHIASDRMLPVLVFEGKKYGPDDIIDGFPAGSVVVTIISGQKSMSNETLRAAKKFVGQSLQHGLRWLEAIEGWEGAPTGDDDPANWDSDDLA